MNRISYFIFRGFLFLFRLIPFWALYIFSDFVVFLFIHVVKYRKKVIMDNLTACFPEKSAKEISQLAKKFYRNLCDIMIESLKGFTMSVKSLKKRYYFVNPEVPNRLLAENRDVMYIGAHYCNWEWGTQVAHYFFDHHIMGLYKPLSNKLIDEYTRKHRMKRGCELYSIYNTALIFNLKRDIPKGYVFVGDQSPSNEAKAIWIKFLNRDTACLHGIEFYAKKHNVPLVYIDVQRKKRGYYELTMDLLFENPAQSERWGEVTETYMRKLESIILKNPENWLWSHRRWKAIKPN